MVEFGVPRSPALRALWRVHTRVGLPLLGRLCPRPGSRWGGFWARASRGSTTRARPGRRCGRPPGSGGALRRLSFGAGLVMWGVTGWQPGAVASTARPSTRCASGGWRDLVTLLHPPYTAWHLSYVVLGAAAAPTIHGGRLRRRPGGVLSRRRGQRACPRRAQRRPLQTGLGAAHADRLAAAGARGAVAIGIAGRDRRLAAAGAAGGDRRVLVLGLQPRAGRRPDSHRRLVRARLGRIPRVHRLLRASAGDPPRGPARGRGLLPAQRRPTPVEHAGA